MKSFLRSGLIPFALLALLGASFALFIPRLGFYYDDWPVVMMTHLKGAGGFWTFYSYDRPFNAWNFMATTPFLQDRPLAWHVFTLVMRWLGTLGLWFSLRLLWPGKSRQVGWMALIFAVYPIFDQQPIAVCYSTHWIAFTLYAFSLVGMLLALRKPLWAVPLTLLSALAAALHIFTIEYFLGLELLRPFLLWIALRKDSRPALQRLKSTFLRWLPYLVAFIVFVIWRLFFLKTSGEDPNRPEMLYAFMKTPLNALLGFAQVVVQDLVKILFGAWYQAADPAEILLGSRSVLFAWGVGLLTALAATLFFYFSQDKNDDGVKDRVKDGRRNGAQDSAQAFMPDLVQDGVPDNVTDGERDGMPDVRQEGALTVQPHADHWTLQAILIGMIAILVGMLPVWVLGKQVFSGLYGGRYGMAAMPGAAIVLVAFLDWLTPRRIARAAVLALLIGVAVSFHLRTAASYATAWSNELQFFWQLHWRAPHLSAPTAIFSDNEILRFMGRDSTSAAINTMYSQPSGTSSLQYWFFELYHDIGEERSARLGRGIPLKDHLRSLYFNADSADSLVLFYKPGAGRCLWVLGPDDADNSELSEITRSALPASDLSRIYPQAQVGYPPQSVFGAEPPRTWCYYYQKAELARSFKEWEEVTRLEDEALAKGFSPANSQEWLVFAEGRARTQDWSAAEKRSLEILRADPRLAPRICNLWSRLDKDLDVPAGTLEDIRDAGECVVSERVSR